MSSNDEHRMRNARSALPDWFPTIACAERAAELRSGGDAAAVAAADELVAAVERAKQAPAGLGTNGAEYATQALRMLEGTPSPAEVGLAVHYRRLLDAWTDIERRMHRIYDGEIEGLSR